MRSQDGNGVIRMDTAEKIKEYEMSFANEFREYGQRLHERYVMNEPGPVRRPETR